MRGRDRVGRNLRHVAGGFILQHILKCHVRFPLPAAKGHKRSQAFELSESLDPLIRKKQLVVFLLPWSASSLRGGGVEAI
jgi:hypothetical protein